MPDAPADWVAALSRRGQERDAAIAALHALLSRAAHAEVHRRIARLRLSGPELDDLADQAADDALVSVTAKLGEFRGESRFTTWAYRFVVLEVSSKIGRHFWTRPRAELGPEAWERLPDRFGIGPAEAAQHADLLAAVRTAVDQDLTAHQREVFVAIVVDGIPLDALAVRLGSNRNALYKTMFDARRKIRAALVTNGYLEGLGGSTANEPAEAPTISPAARRP